MAEDTLARKLAEIRERAEDERRGMGLADGDFPATADDVPALLAALGAVLTVHQDDSYGRCMVCREFCDCFDPPEVVTVEDWGHAAMDCPHGNEPWPCATARAISSALLGEGADVAGS